MTFVVLTEDAPGVFTLVGTFDAPTEADALAAAAAAKPESNIFYAADLSVFGREQVAARHEVIDWQPPLP